MGDENGAGRIETLVICRCEEVTLEQIRACIRNSGARTVNQVKKLTRSGMGPCQGKTCAGLIERILAVEQAAPLGTEPYTARAPVRGIPLGILASLADRFPESEGPVSVSMLRGVEQKEPQKS